MAELKLNQRQRNFVAEYILNSGNGTDAAIKAGYAAASAHSTATRLLKNPKLQNYLAERRAAVVPTIHSAAASGRVSRQRAVSQRRATVRVAVHPAAVVLSRVPAEGAVSQRRAAGVGVAYAPAIVAG